MSFEFGEAVREVLEIFWGFLGCGRVGIGGDDSLKV